MQRIHLLLTLALAASPWLAGSLHAADATSLSEATIVAMQVSDRVTPAPALIQTVTRLLAAARAEVPETRTIHARLPWDPTTLLIGVPVDRELLTADASRTGWPTLDRLNRRFGVTAVEEMGTTYLLRFARGMDMEVVSRRYASVPGIQYAEPNHMIGGGSTVSLSRLPEGRWRLVFTRGWGDCPAGCINNQSWVLILDAEAKIVKKTTTGDPTPGAGKVPNEAPVRPPGIGLFGPMPDGGTEMSPPKPDVPFESQGRPGR